MHTNNCSARAGGLLLLAILLSAAVTAQDLSSLPLFDMKDLTYEGAFRVPATAFGPSDINYSQGPIAYNPDRHSLYMVGHTHQQAIAEFAIPELVVSDSLADLNFAPAALQDFRSFLEDAPGGNPQTINRVGGLLYVTDGSQPKLIVNGYEYYDAPGDNTVTTLIVEDADNLTGSNVRGYLAFAGGAGHTSGWLSPVPMGLEATFGGNYLTGQSSGRPIISRLSVGPSAFAFTMADLLAGPKEIPTTKLLDFSLRNPLHPDLSNDSLQNDVWTHLSKATYGFIVPGTRTYLTLGNSGGHETGVCYKCTPDTGRRCGGYCTPVAGDNYQYYWLWDLEDLLAVKNGAMASYDVRPYDYGAFPTPFNEVYHGIGGGSFDPATGSLYLSIQKGDTDQGRYARPPVVVVYQTPQFLSNVDDLARTAITVYPNPASDRLTVVGLPAKAIVSVFTALGQRVAAYQAQDAVLQIAAGDWPAGMYYLRVQRAGEVGGRTARFVKR